MPLFRKKKKEEEKLELPELPSFSEMQQIKQAIKPSAMPQAAGLPEMPRMPEITPRAAPPELEMRAETKPVLTQEISEPAAVPEFPGARPARAEYEIPRVPSTRTGRAGAIKLKEPIFVKLDRFKDALNNFELIKEKLYEIDELLKKIKETRMREQEELDSWEKEVNGIKNKVAEIDEKLFSKLE